MTQKKKALGRGLSAILESPDTDITSKDISGNYVVGAIAELSIASIESNPFQPRDEFDEDALNQLADSIKGQGIIQPITVRKLGYDKYQLISGERRLKASQLAGLERIPAYIRVANDHQMLEMALVENIQRENLNAMEIAISYQRLMEECGLTQEKLSDRVGKKRSTITNYLRLLKLPPDLQLAIRDEKISMGHARALINIQDVNIQLGLLTKIIKEGLSVRDVERLVKSEKTMPGSEKTNPAKTREIPQKYTAIAQNIALNLNTKVQMKTNTKGSGSIVISFKSEEELDRIFAFLQSVTSEDKQ